MTNYSFIALLAAAKHVNHLETVQTLKVQCLVMPWQGIKRKLEKRKEKSVKDILCSIFANLQMAAG